MLNTDRMPTATIILFGFLFDQVIRANLLNLKERRRWHLRLVLEAAYGTFMLDASLDVVHEGIR